MKKLLIVTMSMIITALVYTGCSRDQMAAFQQNDQEPEYSLLNLFDGFPALNSLVSSIDSQKLNDGLGDMIINGYETPLFLRDAAGLVEAPFLIPMINELHGMLKLAMDTNTVHYDDPSNNDGGFYDSNDIDRLGNFYGAIDQVAGSTDLSADILDMATQVVDYLVKTKDPAEIEEDMGNMMKVAFYDGEMYTGTKVNLGAGTYNLTASGISMNDMVSSIEVPVGMKVTLYQNIDKGGTSWIFTGNNRSLADDNCNNVASSVVIEYDITKLAKLAGKVTMSCDYPMWLNSGTLITDRDEIDAFTHTNTDLGNATKGVIKLLYGLNTIAAGDESVRTTIDDMILQDLPRLLNSDPLAKTKFETMVQNLAKYFAHDEIGNASTYDTSRDYYNNPSVSGHNSGYYVNSSLKETLREILPNAVKLFIKDDDNDPTGENDYSIIKNDDGHSPIETLILALRKLQDTGIDFSTMNMEQSLKRMMTKNAWGVDRTDSGAFKLSYLDHLVYTISAGYHFGYLTRVSSDQESTMPALTREPYDNRFSTTSLGGYRSFNHGVSTNGVMTVNDSMYSLTSNYLLLPEANSYNLALTERLSGGSRIWRSATDSTYATIATDNNRFYLGYDYPVLLLLPTGMAGDGGIPNGGKQALVPANDITSGNDYKSYFPKEADGKGVLNTSEFLMGWLARACWDGQGPYYYADPSATQQTMGGHTGYVYYKPNGEIYALVDKSGASWVYYYPVSGDDVADSTGQRSNRYRHEIKSDYFLAREGSNNAYAAPPMNENGTGNTSSGECVRTNLLGYCIERADKYYLNSSAGKNPSYFRLKEKIAQTDSVRACSSQEEAMYRNFQWLMLEKKFVFTIPMSINSGVLCSMMSVKSAAFVVIEGNGVLGLSTARKGSDNGYWVLKGDEGTEYNTGNNPNYGDSYELGDGRIMVFSTFQDLLLSQVSPPQVFGGLLGDGYVLPDAVGRNIAPVIRLGFLQKDLVASNDKTVTWNTAFANRNRILPLFVALTGSLHDGTYYETASSGNDYNYSGKHKYPMRHVLEGVFGPLAKPYLRRFTSPSTRWVQRVNDDSTTSNTLIHFTPNETMTPETTINNNYVPKESLRSLLSILTGSTDKGTNGLLPMLADNTGMVSRLLGLLQRLGNPAYDAPRADLALGLEQLMTSMKINKSESIAAGYDSQLDHYSKYQWAFTQRDEDVSLEDFLSYEGAYRSTDNWNDFRDFYDLAASLMGGSRSITPNLVNVVNAILAQQLSEDQVHGLLYTAGKLFARHDQNYTGSGVWNYHGYDHGAGKPDAYDQLVDMLTYLPQVHEVMKTSDGSGVKYNRMLQNVDILMKDQNSLVHTLLEGMSTPYSAQAVIEDLDRFLSWSIISDPNSPLWDDLTLMLEAMADMNDPRVDISTIIKNLGFQSN